MSASESKPLARKIIPAIPEIEHMDIFRASKHHMLLRVRFAQDVNFPRLLEQLQFRMRRGKKVRNCEIEQIKFNNLGHWEFHLKPEGKAFPFGRRSIFSRRDQFTDTSVKIMIFFANQWHEYDADLY